MSLTVACVVLGALVAARASAAPSSRGLSGPDVPARVTAGIAVFDRTTGRFTDGSRSRDWWAHLPEYGGY